LKNAKHAQCRQNAENHTRNLMYQRNLNNAFAATADREYRTPIGTIVEAALLAQQLPPNPHIQRLQYLTQCALVQLDGQHPMSSTRNMLSRSERHGDSTQISRTPGGGLGYRGNDNPQGQQSARGNVEQEVQLLMRPPHNWHDARPQGETPPEASLQNAPMTDLR
jgi:signal transduction histidine kinase